MCGVSNRFNLHFIQLGLSAVLLVPRPSCPQSLAPNVNTLPLSGEEK